jgi:3D (Asp-Asp-Asp) domain-containing protein
VRRWSGPRRRHIRLDQLPPVALICLAGCAGARAPNGPPAGDQQQGGGPRPVAVQVQLELPMIGLSSAPTVSYATGSGVPLIRGRVSPATSTVHMLSADGTRTAVNPASGGSFAVPARLTPGLNTFQATAAKLGARSANATLAIAWRGPAAAAMQRAMQPESWFVGALVPTPGLRSEHRIDWLYSARGLSMEGDGVGLDGRQYHISPPAGKTFAPGPSRASLWYLRSVAVDPSVIPLGSHIFIPSYQSINGGWFEADDTGGAIVGRHIDVYRPPPANLQDSGDFATGQTVYVVPPGVPVP